ncbi:hypothetical protein GDO86_002325 [Hymenochirus boettgeri]|nr:hypothetical protein GDO86_002325 [Hymenochirus boettgeri]
MQGISSAKTLSDTDIAESSFGGVSKPRSPTTAKEEENFPERNTGLLRMEAFSPLHSGELSLGVSSSSCSQVQQVKVKELSVPAEDMEKVEDILNIWSGNLKANLMAELSKWRLTIIEQHKLELKNQNENHAEHILQLNGHIDKLQDVIQTYEKSIQRKDEVISNLTRAVDKHKERMELMKTFTHWRRRLAEAKQESYANGLADQHYKNGLLKNTLKAWRLVIESGWKDKVEKACRTRAEEVCIELSNDYDFKLRQLNGALEEARAEVQRLHAEREQFESGMKKAFMRGVCALNVEAMSMFQSRENQMEHDPLQRRDERSSSPSVAFQSPPVASTHVSPTPYDLPSSFQSSALTAEPNFTPHFGPSSYSQPKDEGSISAGISVPTLSTQKLPVTRIVTSGQQKAGKTITARITGRSELAQKVSKSGGGIMSMAVTPPMSSIVVEKHHPVTQQTISQATAAKYPRSVQQSTINGRSTSQSGRVSQGGFHSIKVVD